MFCFILQLKRLLCVVDRRGDIVPHFFMILVLSFRSSRKFPVESLQWCIFYPYPALGPVVRMLRAPGLSTLEDALDRKWLQTCSCRWGSFWENLPKNLLQVTSFWSRGGGIRCVLPRNLQLALSLLTSCSLRSPLLARYLDFGDFNPVGLSLHPSPVDVSRGGSLVVVDSG